ncbi:MAG: hypothetical protein K6T57_09130 [Thermaceae bacterium]|nr:hypothetical protein [Thermaceae bacterium]
MDGQSYWQLDPDLRAVLPKAWKTWELYREDLVGAWALAQEAEEGSASSLAGEWPRGEPQRKVLLEGLSPLIRAPFEGRGWPYLFTAAYLLGNPALSYWLSSISGMVFLLGKYAPELSSFRTQLQGGMTWGAAWLGGRAQGYARDEAWRLSGKFSLVPGVGVAQYVWLVAEHGGEAQGLFLLPSHNRRKGPNYYIEARPGTEHRYVPYGAAELEMSEAYLLGHAEEGHHYAAEGQAIQQMAQALAWAGWGRHLQQGALQLPEVYASPSPDLRHTLTDWGVRLAGALALGFRAVAAWDRTRQEYPPYEGQHFAQFLALLAKARAQEHARAIAHSLARTLGGNLLRWPKLAWRIEGVEQALPWETSAHTEAERARELLLQRRVGATFQADFVGRLQMARRRQASLAAEVISKEISQLQASTPAEALWVMPHALRRLADAAVVALLYDLEATGGERYTRLGELYARRFLLGESYPTWVMNEPQL